MKIITVLAIIALIRVCQTKTMLDVGNAIMKCSTNFAEKCAATDSYITDE